MARKDVNIMIGGEAGQGLATVGQVLSKVLVQSGYHISVTQSYLSRIRGGHNTFTIRTAVEPRPAPEERVDLLVALDQETVNLHDGEVGKNALVLADTGLTCGLSPCLNVPYEELAKKRYVNTLALGVACRLLDLDKAKVEKALRKHFKKLTEEVLQENLEALTTAWDWCTEKAPDFEGLAPATAGEGNLILNGNEAIALGALAGGLKFLSFYPMTPGTSIALTLIAQADAMGLVYEQAEDEIAAINMALGASFAGAPSLVCTSGGGFALMGEGVSLAGMTETPVVVAVVQRPGPATGLPTRTEQADLELVLYAGHGEFPRAVLAPGGVEDCFHLAYRALHLAEDHQSPVFILSDQYQSDSYRTVVPFDLSGLTPVRAGARDLDQGQKYERYALTPSGLSPRAIPGLGRELVLADSDEHTPDGHITEDLDIRIHMNDKRLAKMAGLMEAALDPVFEGPEDPDLLLVCWGSSRGAVAEAAWKLRDTGRRVATCHFSQVWPLKSQGFLPRFEKAGEVVMVEGNATGQLAGLIRRETGFNIPRLVLRYDGLPFTSSYILAKLAG